MIQQDGHVSKASKQVRFIDMQEYEGYPGDLQPLPRAIDFFPTDLSFGERFSPLHFCVDLFLSLSLSIEQCLLCCFERLG